MIFAKLDVTIRGHKRAKKAGAAMSTWTWGLAYCREQETDGFIPDFMISDSFVGEVAGRKDAAKLVAVGLWEVVPDGSGPDGDGGWRMLRYDAKNETKAQINERRAADRERKKPRVHPLSASPPSGIQMESDGKSVGFPGSDSGSGSESRSREPDLPRATPHNDAPPLAKPTELVELAIPIEPPAWWAAAVATASAKVPIVEPDAKWLVYRGAMARKRWAPNQTHAVGWLADVATKERSSRSSARSEPQGGASARARVLLTGSDDS